MPPQDPAIRAALHISYVAIVWSAISGSAAVFFGIQATSLALLGTGADVLIDLTSSVVLVWRFRHPTGHEHAEHRAHLIAASGLLALGVALAAASIVRLSTGGTANPQIGSISIAAVSALGLPLLAARKYQVARRAKSKALRTDAHITVVGASTAALSLVGLALTHAGVRSADPIAALVVAVLAAATGVIELLQRG